MLRVVVLVVACIAVRPAFAKEVVTSTGILDFEVVDRGTSHVLRSRAYAITFPDAPSVSKVEFDAGKTKATALAAVSITGTNALVFAVRPMPHTWGISVEAELDTVAAQTLKSGGATRVSSSAIQTAGLSGRRVVGKGKEDGKTVYVVVDLLWDREHRTTVMIGTGERAPKRAANTQQFVDSFVITRGALGPLDEALPAEGKAIASSVAGVTVTRNAAAYLVRGGGFDITFP